MQVIIPSKKERNKKMDVTLLSNVQRGACSYTILVRISRMWEFHGRNDDEPPKHLDLVVIDQQGTPMYAEIPQTIISTFKPKLQEGKIYYMRKIIIDKAKQFFRPVRSSFMIKINQRTKIAELQDEPVGFPKYTFSLTPLADLTMFQQTNEFFIDVIGRITALSDATIVVTSNGVARAKRLIHLTDLSDNKIEISLWGTRAEEFPGDVVYETGQHSHVIAIFVGTTLKTFTASQPFLSGTSACRWYINLCDIPEIASFYNRAPPGIQQIKKLELLNVDDNQIEEQTLLQLKSIEPFDKKGKKYQCTVTIIRFGNLKTWCYPACPRCNSGTRYENNMYICKSDEAICSTIVHRYTIPVIVTDGTWELEFMMFDDRAKMIIGKSAEKLLKEYSRHDIPPEISVLLGEKLTVIVKVMTRKSVEEPDRDPSFKIVNIKKRHGKDYLACSFKKDQSTSLLENTSLLPMDLPPLLPIHSQKEPAQGFQNMDIDDTTSLSHSLGGAQKRTFQIPTDRDNKETSDEIDFACPLGKKGKKKRD